MFDYVALLVQFLYALWRDVVWDAPLMGRALEMLFLYALWRDVVWDPTLPGGGVTSADEIWLHRWPEDRPEQAASTASKQLSVLVEGLYRRRALTMITNHPLAGPPSTTFAAHGRWAVDARCLPACRRRRPVRSITEHVPAHHVGDSGAGPCSEPHHPCGVARG